MRPRPPARLLDAVIRAGGGRPTVVRALYRGLSRAARGQQQILGERTGRRVSVESWYLLQLVFLTLLSLFPAVLMIVRKGTPPVGVVALTLLNWLAVLGTATDHVAAALMLEEDTRIAGWWPVRQREFFQARLGVLLRPVLQTTAALSTLPLLVLAVTGRPPLLAAFTLAGGLLLQAIGTATAVAAATVFLARRTTDGGRRLAEILAGSPFMVLVYLVALAWPRYGPWLQAHPELLWLLPPAWYAAWGAPLAGGVMLLRGAIGLLAALLVTTVGLRILTSSRGRGGLRPVRSAPPRRHWSDLPDALLRPWLPGREGRALRLLLKAHLREDGRLVGSLTLFPLMLAAEMFLLPGRSAPPGPGEFSAIIAVPYSTLLVFMLPYSLTILLYSRLAEASWLIQLGDLAPAPLLAATRKLAMILLVIPLLALYAFRATVFGVRWPVVVGDVLLLVLLTDAVMIGIQGIFYRPPFTLPYSTQQSAAQMGSLFMGALLAAAGIALLYIATMGVTGLVVCWTVLLTADLALRHRLRRKIRRSPLRTHLS